MGIIPELTWGQRRRLGRRYRREKNALVRIRTLIICRLAQGDSSLDIERSGLCVRSSVSHVGGRYRRLGELGLEDGRRWNGKPKLNEPIMARQAELILGTPQDFGWARPTWTRELLARQLRRDTKARVSVA